MSATFVFLFFCLFVIIIADESLDIMRHSIKPPFAADRIPFWNLGAGAFINRTGDNDKPYIRITPAKQSRTGYLWNTIKSMMIDWEVVLEFHVSSPLRHLGGDGFAFWYVEKSEILGPVYGSMDFWNGLGIFFDTFNNDGRGDNPLISAMFNDGTQRFNPADDGMNQALATCSFPFRNLPETAFAKITYTGNTLAMQLALHRDQSGQPAFIDCFRVNDVVLGVDKFFGITAHTGDVADNHDIYSFNVRDLTPRSGDVNTARELYRERIQQQHAQPSHQEMSARDFQHEVLTLLNQIQEATNMLEMSQVGIENIIHHSSQPGKEGDQATWEGTVWLAEHQAQQLQATAETVETVKQRVEQLHTMAQQGRTQPGPDAGRAVNELRPMVNDQFGKLQGVLKQLQGDLGNLGTRIGILQEDQRISGGPAIFLYLLIFITLFLTGANTFLLFRSRSSVDSRWKGI